MAVRRISELDLITDSIASNENLNNYINNNNGELDLAILSTRLYFEASLSTNNENNTASYYKSVKLTPSLLGQVIVMGDTATSVLVDKITGNQLIKKLSTATEDLNLRKNLCVSGDISCKNNIRCVNLSASNNISCDTLSAATNISCDKLSATIEVRSPDVSCTNLTCANSLTATGGQITTPSINCTNLTCTNSLTATGGQTKSPNISCTNLTCANTADLTAARALWADLAENYEADDIYSPGTLVKFGGKKEITLATDVANAVVTTNPAFLMNSNCEGICCGVALAGRVPIRVVGSVKKFDNLTLSEYPGVARVSYLCEDVIIGKALESSDDANEKTIMCVSKFNFK